MRQFAHILIVALLTISGSGVSSFIMDEPCTGYEVAGCDEGVCPPTCVTCGCCARAAEPAARVAAGLPAIPITSVIPTFSYLSKANPHDILHVPKL